MEKQSEARFIDRVNPCGGDQRLSRGPQQDLRGQLPLVERQCAPDSVGSRILSDKYHGGSGACAAGAHKGIYDREIKALQGFHINHARNEERLNRAISSFLLFFF